MLVVVGLQLFWSQLIWVYIKFSDVKSVAKIQSVRCFSSVEWYFKYVFLFYEMIKQFFSSDTDFSSPTAPTSYSWEMWSAWTACSATCGGGQRSRSRRCVDSVSKVEARGDGSCPGLNTRNEPCGRQKCPGNKQVFSFFVTRVDFVSVRSYSS